MSQPFTKAHAKLLALFTLTAWEFTKGYRQEVLAHDLFEHGLLERKWSVYSMSQGGRKMQFRWAYRRSEMGEAKAKSEVVKA